MAKAPRFKIYNDAGEYIAACKYAEDALTLVEAGGGTIRVGHSKKDTVWVPAQDCILNNPIKTIWDRANRLCA